MKKYIIVCLLASTAAWGDSSSLNVAIPQSPQTYQSDRFRAGDLDCSNAIGSSTNVEFGVVGLLNTPNQFDPYNTEVIQNQLKPQVADVGVYARITIPIGGPKERINCNTLYKLELEKKRLEVYKLQQELNNLRQLKFVEE
jgi:hypothetical protein